MKKMTTYWGISSFTKAIFKSIQYSSLSFVYEVPISDNTKCMAIYQSMGYLLLRPTSFTVSWQQPKREYIEFKTPMRQKSVCGKFYNSLWRAYYYITDICKNLTLAQASKDYNEWQALRNESLNSRDFLFREYIKVMLNPRKGDCSDLLPNIMLITFCPKWITRY